MPGPDFISHAARFFVLAEQASRSGWALDKLFWELSVPVVMETATHLPALTAVVRKTVDPDVLWPVILRRPGYNPLPGVLRPEAVLWLARLVAAYPLPAVLPPEAVPWHNRLVAAWEVHRAASEVGRQNFARLALVRLDGCGMPDGQQRLSRLPEWLAEARKIASGERRVANAEERVASGEWRVTGRPYQELEALAALAAWRPAPRVITPPETLREWVTFWMKLRRSRNPVEKGIASIALLNLPEADLRAASISPVPAGELLQQLATAIQSAAKRKSKNEDDHYLALLNWQPVTGTTWPVTEVRKVADAWLELTRHKNWRYRCEAWRQLIRWDRTGSLDICGMDLCSELVKALLTEEEKRAIWEMSQWAPTAERFTATGGPDKRSRLQQLESVWGRHRVSVYPSLRASAWLAGIRLHQAGLAAEPPESFLNVYLSKVAHEWDQGGMLIFAQWSPGAGAPGRWHRSWHAGWQQQLREEDESIRHIAVGALLRQFLEKEPDRSWRCAALELWRAGTKVSPEARHILGAAFARFQEVRARLAAGEVPDFEEEPTPPAERHRPPLALPPGRIAGGEWKMENEELKMKNGEWRMKHQEATPKLNPRLVPDSPSR